MLEIKVVIADDHPIVLFGVREIIMRDPRFKLVAEATNSSQLIAQLEEYQPDVVITDFNMPGDATYGDGLKLIEYIIRKFAHIQVVVLTMISNNLILSRLHELGVAGVIQKNHLHEEILNALAAVAANRNYQSPAPTSVLMNKQEIDERFASLSPREVEVLRIFVAGYSVSDVARLLKRSVKTVSAQKISAMRKLAVESDQALLTYCIKAGQFQ
ncbi:response regulator [Pseudomonas helleri]|jgi:two-component system capsular synthesis response regulator RcsB|uniref:response regulator n=1 Tax=Pseudomonas helleri TaxID=1608996 RepID=UPI002F35D35D